MAYDYPCGKIPVRVREDKSCIYKINKHTYTHICVYAGKTVTFSRLYSLLKNENIEKGSDKCTKYLT